MVIKNINQSREKILGNLHTNTTSHKILLKVAKSLFSDKMLRYNQTVLVKNEIILDDISVVETFRYVFPNGLRISISVIFPYITRK